MKENINNEFQSYIYYLRKYFPYSTITTQEFELDIKNIFEEAMTLSKIALCLSDTSKVTYLMNLIEYNLNNLIYFLPLNEPISLNISVRNCTEAILKLTYTLEDVIVNHSNTGYRTMKDDKNRLSFYKEKKDKLDNIFFIYAERSNMLHLKMDSNIELTTILEKKINRKVNIDELKSLTNDIKNCRLILLEVIFFYNIELTTQQKLILKKLLSRKWKDKIFSLM